jgi:hypothetical protein
MPTLTLENPNLVEVTIYGIASLYERPREDKKMTAASGSVP